MTELTLGIVAVVIAGVGTYLNWQKLKNHQESHREQLEELRRQFDASSDHHREQLEELRRQFDAMSYQIEVSGALRKDRAHRENDTIRLLIRNTGRQETQITRAAVTDRANIGHVDLGTQFSLPRVLERGAEMRAELPRGDLDWDVTDDLEEFVFHVTTGGGDLLQWNVETEMTETWPKPIGW